MKKKINPQEISDNFLNMAEEKKLRYINGIGVGLIIVIMLVFGIVSAMKISDINAKIMENDKKILAIRDEINKEMVKTQPDTDKVKKNFVSAREAGSFVAEKQNEFQTVDVKSKDYSKKFKAIADDLSEYFKDDTSNQTGRTPWYLVDDADFEYKWEFLSNYSFEGDSLSVIWICNDGKNILAYTTADYDGKTGKFYNFKTTNTGLGAATLKPADADNPDNAGLESLIESIREAGGDEQAPEFDTQASKDFQDMHDARQKLKESQQGGE